NTTETVQTPDQLRTSSSPVYKVEVEQVESLIHQKMNERRVRNGVEPFDTNKTLDKVAQYKSWDMAQRDYFAHTGPNGTTHMEVREEFQTVCTHTGQNLHYQEFSSEKTYEYRQSELHDSEEIAFLAVSSLLNSPGHRENALSPHYDSQGIGVFVDENGTVFVTQEFCG
ncbi:MAG: CAP domain-containing protein, partial [Halolamina sp.]